MNKSLSKVKFKLKLKLQYTPVLMAGYISIVTLR